jgi:uroporphyrin-III C-methyltransferase
VVRLKGGCPSTFSRVSGEMAALSAAGMPFQLVPGVSSVLAAPLLAGPYECAAVSLLCRF